MSIPDPVMDALVGTHTTCRARLSSLSTAAAPPCNFPLHFPLLCIVASHALPPTLPPGYTQLGR